MGDWEDNYESSQITCRNGGHILEVGFGMGISVDYIQQQDIKSHTIIELNDEIMIKQLSGQKITKIIHGDWKT